MTQRRRRRARWVPWVIVSLAVLVPVLIIGRSDRTEPLLRLRELVFLNRRDRGQQELPSLILTRPQSHDRNRRKIRRYADDTLECPPRHCRNQRIQVVDNLTVSPKWEARASDDRTIPIR